MNDDYKGLDLTPHIHPFLNSIPYVYIYLYATENFYEKCVKTKKNRGENASLLQSSRKRHYF